MKAVVYTKYGPPSVLRMVEKEKPEPADNEILVRVKATSVTAGDSRLRSSNFPAIAWLPVRLMYGLFSPRKDVLGHEFSGIVEAVGSSVTKYRVGDEVVGTPTMLKTGTYIEYIAIPEQRKKGVLGMKPGGLSHEEAATLPVGGMTALCLLQNAGLARGQRVLIYGASGSVGSYAVQVAKAAGANVVAVCSGRNAELMMSIGADRVVDYRKKEYESLADKFDIVFDAVGKLSRADKSRLLKKKGSFASVKSLARQDQACFDELLQLVVSGHIKPVIDRVYPLSEMVDAHAYVDGGHKKGNVAIAV